MGAKERFVYGVSAVVSNLQHEAYIYCKKQFWRWYVMQFWNCLFHSIVFVVSLSTDAFAASTAYGAGGIRIPWRSAVVISLICSGMLAAAITVGSLLQEFIPSDLVRWVCFFLLFSIGFSRLFDSALKEYIRRHENVHVKFVASNLNFILTIYADSEIADADHSKDLSSKEAAALALALSLDGLVVGIGAALTGIGVITPTVVSLLLTMSAILLGRLLGKRLKSVLPFDLSIISALLLILIAIIRLLQ